MRNVLWKSCALAVVLGLPSGCEQADQSQEKFWQIVDRAASAGTTEQQRTSALREMLQSLSPQDLEGFQKQLMITTDSAYRWDLWAAAYILNGGCSDDCFMDFRNWLVSNGREDFDKALKEPDSIGALYHPEVGTEFMEYGAVGIDLFIETTGTQPNMIEWGYPWTSEPLGEEWSEEDLPTLLPKTWKVAEAQWGR